MIKGLLTLVFMDAFGVVQSKLPTEKIVSLNDTINTMTAARQGLNSR